VQGTKVLHVDRNGFYGGEGASLNLTNLWKKFKPNEPVPAELGADRDWNVDLIPKLIMANGLLVKMLLHTGVTAYLEWKECEGTYVYQYQEAGFFSSEKFIHKVPNKVGDVLSSNLMSMMEKTRVTPFFQFVLKFDERG
jgi:Rab GDP dissociation inhibitor